MSKIRLCLWLMGVTIIVSIVQSPTRADYRRAATFEYVTDRIHVWCIERVVVDLIETVPFPEDPIVPGCEVIDCCPGCPGPGPLDWRIQLSDGPIEGIELQFENLPERDARAIKIQGEGRWLPNGRLRVGRGKTILRGINPGGKRNLRSFMPSSDEMIRDLDRDPASRPPTAIPHPKIDKAAAKRLFDKPSKDDIRVEFVVEQMLGSVVVNEFVIVYAFRICVPRFPLADKIDLDNNAANDEAVILLDGRRSSGCVDNEVWRGKDVIAVGNVLSPGNCNCEVIVFSDDDAMQWKENVAVWTDASGDTLKVDLTPDALQVPVSVWLMRANALAVAQQDVAQASMLYNTSNCGIVFNATYQDVSNNQNAVNLVGTNNQNMCWPQWLTNLQGSNFYNAGQLNVYYVNGAFTALNCINDRNICVVGTQANNQSLAHEFGHSFSLGCANNVPGIPATNVMVGGGANRTEFTEGQCFRCNVNPGSTLNTNGVRTGSTRNCPDATSTDKCPPLTLDVTPN